MGANIFEFGARVLIDRLAAKCTLPLADFSFCEKRSPLRPFHLRSRFQHDMCTSLERRSMPCLVRGTS